MKLCKDCKHIKLHVSKPAEYSECLYVNPITVEPVTGQPKPQPYTICTVLRRSLDSECCGPDARFFEPKDPIATCVEGAMRDFLTDAVRQ